MFKVHTFVVSYHLIIKNVSHATSIGNKKGTEIGYIGTDGSLTINKAYIFDILFKPDHMATLNT